MKFYSTEYKKKQKSKQIQKIWLNSYNCRVIYLSEEVLKYFLFNINLKTESGKLKHKNKQQLQK